MCALPIVSGSEVNTPASGVQMNSGAFREAALAPGRLAQAIGQDVGGLFQDVSQKIQANRNARQVFQADLAMRKQKDDFTASLAKMPDENTWLPAWQQQADSLREKTMSSEHIGPDVRKVLAQKFDIWQAATSAEIRTQALRKGVKETRESAIADSTYAAHQGDLEGANNTLKAAVAHYAMSEAESKKISSRFPSIAAQAQADTAIATNPIKAPELIKKFESAMEPRMYVGIMAKANAAKNRAQADNLNDWAMQMDNSPDETVDPKELDKAVQNGEITRKGADGLITRMTRKKKEESQQDFTVAYAESYDHNWTEDKTPEQSAREMKDKYSHLPEALRVRLYKDIDSRVLAAKKRGETEERPVEKQVLSQMAWDRTNQGLFFPSSPLGEGETRYGHLSGGVKALEKMKDEEVQNLYGVSKDKVMEAEKLHYATMQQKMRDWFRDPANKDATIEQANEYRMKLEQPFVHEAAKASLTAPTHDSEIANLLKKYGQ